MKKLPKTTKLKSSVNKLAQISRHAKQTRKPGEKWSAAIRRASKELKQQ